MSKNAGNIVLEAKNVVYYYKANKGKKVLDDIEKFPEEDTYETIAGFMMYMLKSIPKKGAVVDFENYTFEVVDVDRFKIDQLLVTRKNSTENIN